MNASSPGSPLPAFSCDTLVGFAGEGPERRVIFAKNSDRPWDEAQPLTHVPAAHHAPGSTVRCQYLTVPQAERTLAVLGSRPWWLWGFEHGLNSAGVAIGNEAIYTRDEVPSIGLIGMDLVRLGLERGQTAAAAKQVIASHVERYGQGGSAMYLRDARYHNSFIIADATEAYVLEASGRRWVSKRVTSSVAIANLVTITDDWDERSPDVEDHARDQGWWNEPASVKFDFRAAYEDASMRVNTEARYQQNCRLLHLGQLTVRSVMRQLRDHFEGGTTHVPDSSADHTRPRSICLHPEPWAFAGTTASMVADLTVASQVPIAWCSMTTPCTGAFVPIPVSRHLPDVWSIGSDLPDERSLWWIMREVAEAVGRDYASLTPIAQQAWAPWEEQVLAETKADPDGAADRLEERTAWLLASHDTLMSELRAGTLLPG